MNSAEIKNNLHILVDRINNENLLLKYYELISKSSSGDGKLWDKLNKVEQEELLNIDDAIESGEKTIAHSEMKQKYNKWL